MLNAVFCALPLITLLLVASRQRASQDLWADWKFQLGDWNTQNSSRVPGQASKGGFSLTAELDGEILVRKNHAEYPTTEGRPAFSHEDLMIIYHDGGVTKAYYDYSEGHIIHYDVTVSPDKKEIVFLSEKGAAGPQYRLTYDDFEAGAVKVLFEIAPADKPGQFATYVEAVVHRN